MMILRHKMASILGAGCFLVLAFPIIARADAINPYVYKGSDRQQLLEEGAKKEGHVLFYSGWVANQILVPLTNAFHQRYPFIDIQYVEGNGRSHVQKIAAEGRARSPFGDIVSGTCIAESLIKGALVVPFYSPSADNYASIYKPSDGLYVSADVNYYGVSYNTKLVKPEDVPQTYEDLLDSKWRGKIVWPSVSDSGALLFVENILLTMGDEQGEAYLKKLGENNVVNYNGSARAMVDRVGQGEYALGLASFAHHPILSQLLGAPLDISMLEPVPVDIDTIMAIKGAPHPFAAMLLIDFILSRDGESPLRDAGSFPTRPDVEPIAAMRKVIPQSNGKKMNVFTPEAVFQVRDKALTIMDRYFR